MKQIFQQLLYPYKSKSVKQNNAITLLGSTTKLVRIKF